MKNRNWLPVIAAILITTGSGCAETVVRSVPQSLPLPERPILPAIGSDELQCLSPETYRKLTNRQRLRREYAEELEAIIKGTHSDG